MIGHSRRNSEARRRRSAWLATLTPEQRREESDYQDYVGKVVLRSAPPVLLVLLLAICALDGLRAPYWRPLELFLAMVSVPASFAIPFFLVKPRSRWRGPRR